MKTLLSALLALALSCTSFGLTRSYTVGTDSKIDAHAADPGLVISTKLYDVAGLNFSLDDGQKFDFDFFKIWTNETDVGKDDTKAYLIEAILDFSNPNVDAVLDGTTVGYTSFLGVLQYGLLTWKGPSIIVLKDRTFSVSLENAKFNSGFLGLDEGPCAGAKIKAHVKQCSSTKVPDSATTLSLLGLSLLGLACLRRSRKF